MERELRKKEILTGIVVAVAMLIFVVIIFASGGFLDALKPKTEYKIFFRNAGGLENQARVQMFGMPVGKVIDTRIGEHNGNSGVIVTIAIDPLYELGMDTTANIVQDGLLGKKYVEVEPARPDPEHPFDPSRDVIIGREEQGLQQVFETLNDISGEMKDVLRKTGTAIDSIADFIGDKELQTSIKSIAVKGDNLIDEIDAVAGQLGKLVDESGPKVKEALESIASASAEVEAVVSENRSKVNEVLDNFASASAETEEWIAENRPAITGLIERVNETVAEFATMKEGLESVLAAAEKALQSADSALTSVEGIVDDNYRNLYKSIESLKIILRNFEVASEKIARNPAVILWGDKSVEGETEKSRAEFERSLRQRGDIPIQDEEEE